MRGDATFGREDALGGDHTAQVFRRGFGADEEDFFSLVGSGGRAVGIQIDFARCGTRTGGKSAGEDFGLLDLGEIEHRSEELVELISGVAQDGGFPVDELLIDHVDREFERGHGGALSVPCLEHEQLAFLDREFEILHVLEVFFERLADFFQFRERFWQLILEKGDRLGGADACDDVFALRVDEEFAVEFFYAIRRVAGERDAGTGFFTGVAEDHGLDVDSRAPFGGDVVFPAIDDRAVVHPGAEDGSDGAFELVPGIRREQLSGAFFDELLEALDELLLVSCGQLAVHDIGVIFVVLVFVDDGFEWLVIFPLAFLNAEDDIPIHLDEAAVAIPRKAFVLRCQCERGHRFVIETEVEDRIHHARHRVAGPRAHGNEEGEAFRIAEFGSHDFLHVADTGFDLGLEFLGIRPLVGVEIRADFRRDRESGGHRQADAGHLGEVGTFAAEQGFHFAITVGFAITPGVNIFALAGRHGLH